MCLGFQWSLFLQSNFQAKLDDLGCQKQVLGVVKWGIDKEAWLNSQHLLTGRLLG